MKTGLKLSSMQILAIGFALFIIIGGVLLSLPIASRDGQSIPFLNGLFTSTSATCVTGLALYDTYTQFTLFGQIVILLLIQTGGLGFMIVAIMLSLILGRRIGLRERKVLMQSVSALKLGGVVKLTKKVFILTICFELMGAAILSIRFIPQFGAARGIWYALFHSISSFCNAGFDLLGRIEPFGSLTPYVGDALVNITVMVLIVIGGLGFFIWDDVTQNKHHFSKYHLHSKLMITATGVLIVGGAILFYVFEKSHTMADMGVGERILASMFASITPRTAGFSTVQVGEMSSGGTLLTMVLMLIGAGPGSTGGGMKVTTVLVLILAVVSRAKNREDMNIFKRRLDGSLLHSAATSASIYLLFTLVGSLILSAQGMSVTDTVFEAVSGIGTIGLTTGVTPGLSVVSRIVVMLLMFAGRVGSLSVATVMMTRRARSQAAVKYVSERIILG